MLRPILASYKIEALDHNMQFHTYKFGGKNALHDMTNKCYELERLRIHFKTYKRVNFKWQRTTIIVGR